MLERISLASSSSCTSSTGLQALSRGIFSTGFYDDFFCGVGQVLIELFTDWTYGQSVGEGGLVVRQKDTGKVRHKSSGRRRDRSQASSFDRSGRVGFCCGRGSPLAAPSLAHSQCRLRNEPNSAHRRPSTSTPVSVLFTADL